MRLAAVVLLGLLAITSAFAQSSKSPDVCEGTDWYHLTIEEIAAEVASGDLGLMTEINNNLPGSPCSSAPIEVVAQKVCTGITDPSQVEWSAKALYRCSRSRGKSLTSENVWFKGSYTTTD